MRNISIFKHALACVFILALYVSVNAQEAGDSATLTTLKAAKSVTFVVVGETAKFSYKTTKFAAKHVAKPIVVSSAPAVGKFMLRSSGTVVKKSFPVVRKLAVKYLKYKFL